LTKNYPDVSWDIITNTTNETQQRENSDEKINLTKVKLNLDNRTIKEGDLYRVKLIWEPSQNLSKNKSIFIKAVYRREKMDIYNTLPITLGLIYNVHGRNKVYVEGHINERNINISKKVRIKFEVKRPGFIKSPAGNAVAFIGFFILLGEFCRIIYFFIKEICSKEKKIRRIKKPKNLNTLFSKIILY